MSTDKHERTPPRSTPRPVDHLPRPATWKHTIAQALHAGRCAKCGTVVWQSRFRDELSLQEYRLSAMCQSCQDAFFDEHPDSAWNVEAHDYGPKEMT